MSTMTQSAKKDVQRPKLRKGYYSFTDRESDFEKSTVGRSQTVPDQSYTVKELLEKFTKNIDVGRVRTPIYMESDMSFDDHDVEEIQRMDVNDKDILRQENEAKLRDLKRVQDARKKKRDDAAAAKALEEKTVSESKATTKEEAKPSEQPKSESDAAKKSEQK